MINRLIMAPYSHQSPPLARSIRAYLEMEHEDQHSSVGSSIADEAEEEELADVFPPPPNVLPESLSLENSLPQLLMSQCGVSQEYELAEKTKIRLRIISREMSLQRLSIYMPLLIELDLSGSCLLSLRDLGCGLKIKILKVNHCGLDCLDGLLGLTTIKELHAQSNYIRDIGTCAVLPRLQLLDLTRNQVENLGLISFLTICTQLRDLNLSQNPVSAHPEYRNVVIELLPELNRLNGEMLPVDEKDDVNETKNNKEANGRMTHNDSTTDDVKEQGKANKNEDLKENTQTEYSINTPLTENKGCSANFDTKTLMKRERPSTSIGIRHSALSMHQGSDKQRPHTAGGSAKKIGDIISNEFIEIDNEEENSVSRLTSGGIVCGNLTAALRSRTRHNRKLNEDLKNTETIRLSNLPLHLMKKDVNKISTAQIDKTIDQLQLPEIKNENRTKEVNALLDASRKWRVAYSKFRNTNREKWEKEIKNEDKISEDEESE